MNSDCSSCKNCEFKEDMQKRRQIQLSYNSGGYSVIITSDYKNEDIDYLSTKAKDLIKELKMSY